MNYDNKEEMFPIVDEQGNITGAATRGECHNGSKLLHPVVHLHVFNSKGVEILKGLRDRYEAHHKVRITDEAIAAAVQLSDRYITDRYLPDKAIDLIDEGCALIRTEMDSMPTELDVVSRKIIQMEIEEAALKKEEDPRSKARLAELQKELAEEREQFNSKMRMNV